MKYFTIKELSHSDTALAKGIDNFPTAEAISNLTKLVDNVLDPLREKYGKPIRVSSGYRSAILNRSVNGATSRGSRRYYGRKQRRESEAIRNNQKRIAFRSVNRRKGFFLGTRVIQRRT